MKLIDILSSDNKKAIGSLLDEYQKKKDKSEFEISFFSNKELSSHLVTLEQINQLLTVLTVITERNKDTLVTNTRSLDIIFSLREKDVEEFVNYRVTINTLEKINEYMEKLSRRKNSLIFSLLVNYIQDTKDKEISLIKKTKQRDKYITLEDVYMRFKLDKEEEITKDEMKKLQQINKNYDPDRYSILYRYKDRKSFILEKDKNKFRIDITTVKQTSNINLIDKSSDDYEIELELLELKNNKTIEDNVYSICEFIIKIIQQNNIIISKSLSNKVVEEYKKAIGQDSSKNSLFIRKPISLGVQHMDDLQNKYAVTDKADGERYNLFVHDEYCYLINNNLIVKNTNMKVDKKYNNSILDGELIFLKEYNKYIFMAFDCMMIKGENITEENSLMNRLGHGDELIYEINNCKYKHKDIVSSNINISDIEEITKFHKENIYALYEDLTESLKKSDKYILFRRKYFMDVVGIKSNEIFKYAFNMWKQYTMDSKFKGLYPLDGLIFQPLQQKYITQREKSKYHDFKWKPSSMNSIDFYIEFEKDIQTGNILKVYDNSTNELRNKMYYICNLYVNQNIKGIETPVLFKENADEILFKSYLYLDDNGIPRSEDGKIIHDKTVVEFSFLRDIDTNITLTNNLRWRPMRTRYEKTYIVNKYRKGYGNYIDVAENIWSCITNPINIVDFENLSKDSTYDKHLKSIRERIDLELVRKEERIYYQNTNRDINKEMRNFHNWIKSDLFYTYMSSTYNYDIQPKHLEIAIGQGGDLEKYYFGNPEIVIGFDIDYNGIIKPNGAINRYNNFKKKHRRMPPVYFLLADGGNLLKYDEQVKAVGRMPEESKKLFNKYFTWDENRMIFDNVSCQFAIHYLFKTEETWKNNCENINKHLHEGGYFICTTFDGDRIREKLKDKDRVTMHYNDNGEKKLFFDLVKKYDDNDKSPYGQTIDVMNSWISEDYNSEYLVFYDFIVNSLDKYCNMELIESDTFDNIYGNYKEHLEIASKEDYGVQYRKTMQNVLNFYDDSSETVKMSREVSFMNRYYVFRKRVTTSLKENKNKYYGSTRKRYNRSTRKIYYSKD